jgi:alkaline phosphatase
MAGQHSCTCVRGCGRLRNTHASAAGWARDRNHDAKADEKLREELSLAFSGRARNVILFLGDGMGDSEITSARNYHGHEGNGPDTVSSVRAAS